MSSEVREALFYSPWPKLGKRLNFSWGEVRRNHAETKAIVRASYQDVDTDDDFINAQRAYAGSNYGEDGFQRRWRIFYDKVNNKFCIQENTGTNDSPVWEDRGCWEEGEDCSYLHVDGLKAGDCGIFSTGGFYGVNQRELERVGEAGSGPNTIFTHPRSLWFNDLDFYLTELTSGDYVGQPLVNMKNQFGMARSFRGAGKQWTIGHGFKTTPVVAQAYDTAWGWIIPDKIDVSDPNTTYFYFCESVSGHALIATGGIGAAELIPKDPFYLVVRRTGEADVPRFNIFADLVFNKDDFYVKYDRDDNQAFIDLGDSFANLSVKVDENASNITTLEQPNFYLNDVLDVNAPSPTNDQVLAWDEITGKWIPQSGLGGGAFYMNDLKDVNAPSPADNNTLKWNASTGQWEPGDGDLEVSDGSNDYTEATKISFNDNDFYLSGDLNGQPVVNVKSKARIQAIEQATADVEWQIAHNFDTNQILVQVFDDQDVEIMPTKADTSDRNTAYFYFTEAVSGKVVVAGIEGAGATPSVVSDHHELNGLSDDDHTQYILVDGSRAFTGRLAGGLHVTKEMIADGGFYSVSFGETAYKSDLFNEDHGSLSGLADDDHTQYILADGTRAFTGTLQGDLNVQKTVVAEAFYSVNYGPVAYGHRFEISTPAVEWQINHNFEIKPLMAQVYDDGDLLVIPDTQDLSDTSTAYFYFASAMAGSVSMLRL